MCVSEWKTFANFPKGVIIFGSYRARIVEKREGVYKKTPPQKNSNVTCSILKAHVLGYSSLFSGS